MGHHTEALVGIDTSKSRNAIAIADGTRGGKVRYLGEFPAMEAAIRKLVARLAEKHHALTDDWGVEVASIDAIMPDLVHGIGYTPTDTAQ